MRLPLAIGEYEVASGEVVLSGGESLCLGTSLPSEALPPGWAGLEQRDVVGTVLLLAAEEEEEEETERVGLSWFPRRSWYGTVARIGCNRTVLVLLLQEEAVGEPPCLSRCCCWDEGFAADAAAADILLSTPL